MVVGPLAESPLRSRFAATVRALGTGPRIVIGRPRSGTRLLARAFLDSGVFMGSRLSRPFLDSLAWYEQFVRPLMVVDGFPSSLDDHHVEQLADQTLHSYATDAHAPGRWGWKYPESLFLVPQLVRLFPTARFVHLIRDGRDVALSRNGYFQLSHRPFGEDPMVRTFYRRILTGGDAAPAGIDLEDGESILRTRFELQMRSWITCVSTARRHGNALGDRYVEVRYEDLCRQPRATLEHLFARLDLPLHDVAVTRLAADATEQHIGRWRSFAGTPREHRDWARALELGAPLLTSLGYAEA